MAAVPRPCQRTGLGVFLWEHCQRRDSPIFATCTTGLQKHRRELWREFGISLKAGYKILEGKKIRSTLAGC